MLFVGVDLGTSAVKLLLMDENGKIKMCIRDSYKGLRTGCICYKDQSNPFERYRSNNFSDQFLYLPAGT